jgi:hypothetical protein
MQGNISEITRKKISAIGFSEISNLHPEISEIVVSELLSLKDREDFHYTFKDDVHYHILDRGFSIGVTDKEVLSVDSTKFIKTRAGIPFNLIYKGDEEIPINNYRGFEIRANSMSSMSDYLKDPEKGMGNFIKAGIGAIKKDLGLNIAELYRDGGLDDNESVQVDLGECLVVWYEDPKSLRLGCMFSIRVFIHAVKH